MTCRQLLLGTIAGLFAYLPACGEPPPETLAPDAVPSFDAAPMPPDADLADAESPPAPDAGFQAACTLEELQPIGECARDNCSDVVSLDAGIDPGALAACIGTYCTMELLSVSPECRQCLAAATSTSIEELVAACT